MPSCANQVCGPVALLAGLLATGCATPRQQLPSLPPDPGPAAFLENAELQRPTALSEILKERIEAVIDEPPLDGVHFGVLAIDAETGRALYSRNAGRRFAPASNQKILTSAAALSLLGADHRYATEVWATGSSFGSTLDGDLVVIGSGDPTFSHRFRGSGEEALRAIADSLYRTGLRHVTGSVFVDVSAWDSTSVIPTREVEDLRFGYGATGGAFAIDEGVVEIEVVAGPAVGSPASVSWRPIGTADFVVASIQTEPPGERTRVRSSYLPESRKLRLEGVVALGEVDTLAFASRDPVRQASAALRRAIVARGIEVEGTAQVIWQEGVRVGRGCLSGGVRDCPNAARLASVRSPTMAELVAVVLGVSQNWIAEQLVLTLGAEIGETGSRSEGVRVLREFLIAEAGVDSLDIAPRDGSGLSAYNLVTPRALVGVLGHMRGGHLDEIFKDALAAPGEEESTLEERLEGLEGRLFAKTGTISNVNSLSGYLETDSGREVIFSVLSNGSGLPSSRVRAAIDNVVRVLAETY